MYFDPPLQQGQFIKRYKRFFVDVRLPDDSVVTAHCPNTGSLMGCLVEGAPVLIQPADNPARKLRYTWKFVTVDGGQVGVDTSIANRLVEEAIAAGTIPALRGYERMTPEVKYGKEGRSRIDILLSRGGQEVPSRAKRKHFTGDERVYVEVKNTTLAMDQDGVRAAAFPDAVTERGRKHLEELVHVIGEGHRAAMVFSVQRTDCDFFVPADRIDPAYAETLRSAVDAGVEVYALAPVLDDNSIELAVPLEVRL